ncbi:type II toxin-antitoxin system MqsA family antitoxin [Methanosarcinales archaeon]|nr:MAG: type II toxin-antitoxin system MqsA family antitoxin [Methanosarcinales archaeon]
MEPCSICGGEMEEKEVEVIKKAGKRVVVVKDVPAWVCKQCGERYYSIDTVERIEGIVKEVREEKVKMQKIFAGELNFKVAITG